MHHPAPEVMQILTRSRLADARCKFTGIHEYSIPLQFFCNDRLSYRFFEALRPASCLRKWKELRPNFIDRAKKLFTMPLNKLLPDCL